MKKRNTTMIRPIFLLVLLGLLGSSCQTLSPFTEQVEEEAGLTSAELERVQFYLSRNIVMRREFAGTESRIQGGEIKLVDGRQVEEVVIPKGTPGVLLFSPREGRLAIGFEEGFNNRYLMFGPSPRSNGQYALLASEWRRNQGRVTYDTRAYWVTVDRYGSLPGLMVNLKKIRQVRVQSRRAGGRKVD